MSVQNEYDEWEWFADGVEAKLTSVIEDPERTDPAMDLMIHKASFILGEIIGGIATFKDGIYRELFLKTFSIRLLKKELVMGFLNGTVCAILTIPRYPNQGICVMSASPADTSTDKYGNEVSAATDFLYIVKEGLQQE